jgi:hypothetical protein
MTGSIPHSALIAIKVAILEQIAVELLMERFMRLPDPVAGAIAYAEERRQSMAERSATGSEDALLVEEVWTEFLDRLVASVRAQAA